MSARLRLRRICLVGVVLTIAGLAVETPAVSAAAPQRRALRPAAPAARVSLRVTRSHLFVQLTRSSRKRVAFVVDGNRVAVRRRFPYKVRITRTRLSRMKVHRLVLRDAHTGARLATRYISFVPRHLRTRKPSVSILPAPPAQPAAPVKTAPPVETAPPAPPAPGQTVPPPVPAGPSAAGPPAAPVDVAAPLAPAAYDVPGGAIYVRNGAELTAALQNAGRDIVLADGVYSGSSPFLNSGGDRLYAEHLGKAVLQAGLVIGSNYGPTGGLVRGLVFDLSDASRALGGGALHIWGAGGANTQVLDSVFRGGSVVPVGILAYNPQGLRIERVQIANFTDVGIRASDNVQVPYGGSTPRIDVIQDVSISGISRLVPGSSNGTAESGLWVGHPVQNGVRRVRIRDAAWSGIETVNNAWDTTFTDLDVDLSGSRQAAGVGIYLERYSRYLTFDRFALTGVRVGVAAEWADPAAGGVAGAHFVKIQNGVVDAAGSTVPGRQAGIYLDEGTEATTVSSVTFRNQNWAAVGAFKTIGANSFTQLQTSQLLAGAVPVSNAHL